MGEPGAGRIGLRDVLAGGELASDADFDMADRLERGYPGAAGQMRPLIWAGWEWHRKGALRALGQEPAG
jgi:hypothetical protein